MRYLGNEYHRYQEWLAQEQGISNHTSKESSVIVLGAMLLAGLVLVGVWMAGKLG